MPNYKQEGRFNFNTNRKLICRSSYITFVSIVVFYSEKTQYLQDANYS